MTRHDRTLIRLAQPRILLAEDDPTMRELLAAVLLHEGYRVVEVTDGRALLAILGEDDDRRRFDLVVTDDWMPGRRGIDVLARLHASRQGLRVILITAFADEILRAEAVALGACAVLDKPFDLDDFRAIVANLLSPRLN
jgi:DNA-binding response OmpR family regulator